MDGNRFNPSSFRLIPPIQFSIRNKAAMGAWLQFSGMRLGGKELPSKLKIQKFIAARFINMES